VTPAAGGGALSGMCNRRKTTLDNPLAKPLDMTWVQACKNLAEFVGGIDDERQAELMVTVFRAAFDAVIHENEMRKNPN
jgi:hypothetical protein